MLTQPMPTPSARAANHKFWIAKQTLNRSASRTVLRPSTWGAAARAVTGNAEIKWALQDSFELQGTVQLGPLALIIGGGTLILTSEHLLDRVPKHWVVVEGAVPGLHEATRTGCVGGRGQPG